jgi:predicted MFS family arabinose efflux permease
VRLVRTVLGNRGIAQLEAGWALTSLGAWTFSIALALYAYYEQGAGGVALAVAARMLPAALLGPLAERLGEGHQRRSVLAATALLRFALLEAIAIVVSQEMAFGLLLALAAAFEITGTVQRPARAALLVELARTPGELAAASAWRFADQAGFVAGGAAAAILLSQNGLDVAFAAAGVPFLFVAALAWVLPARAVSPRSAGFAEGLRGGVRAVAAHPWMRLHIGLFTTSAVVQSMLELLLVVTALDLLGMGSDGVGWLRAALAAGGLAGGALAVSRLRDGRLATGLAAGLVLAGVPLALVAAWPETAPALILLALLGAGYALVEAALLLLTQRLAPPDALARLAGIEEIAYPIARAAGTGLAAWLVVGLGDKQALVVGGLVLPAAALLAARALRRAEHTAPVPERAFRLLRTAPSFASVPNSTLENLALCATEERFEADQSIDADGFRAIESGTVEVDGAQLGPGSCLGEAALLRAEQGGATAATALTAVTALTLSRADFMSRVTPPSRGSTPR